MSDYTNNQITEFLIAANRDLGSGKYKDNEMIPDYAKTVIIAQQLQAENNEIKAANGKLAVLALQGGAGHDAIVKKATELQAKVDGLREIVERIMTQHWDMAACKCWICTLGRNIGCRPREGYPTSPLGTEEFGRVTVEQSLKESEV